MDTLVLGSVAFDSVETPMGKVTDRLGGSASYFACAARYFVPVHMVSVVGVDFSPQYTRLFNKKKIDLQGLHRHPGKTFRWKGFYGDNLNEAQTLQTHLNVLKTFVPHLPSSYRSIPAVFLANFDPELQMSVLKQLRNPQLVACDTMNLWINAKQKALKKLLKKVDIFVLNETEAKQLTGHHNLIKAARLLRRFGPRHIVIKKGEHGCLLYSENALFTVPAFPMEKVYDPTGAGDAFAGGFFGYLASKKSGTYSKHLRQAVLYGSIMASFTIESFSLDRLTRVSLKDIHTRLTHFKRILRF